MTKLEQLAQIEGYTDTLDLLQDASIDSVNPGICTNPDCDYTTEVEPDQAHGYCENCCTYTVASPLVLEDII